MLGTVVKIDKEILKILVKNDAACCGGGGGGCACGGSDPVYVEARNRRGLPLEEGDTVEFQALDSTASGAVKVFLLPGLLALGVWNLLPALLGRTDQPLQLAAALGAAFLTVILTSLGKKNDNRPEVLSKVPNFNLKTVNL